MSALYLVCVKSWNRSNRISKTGSAYESGRESFTLSSSQRENDPQGDRNPIESIASDMVDSMRVGQSQPLEPVLVSNPEHEGELRELLPVIQRLEQARKAHSHQQSSLASLGVDRPESLGDFDLVRQIGRGGMGVVFEATQRSLGRRVAVKVLPKSLLVDKSQLKRFEREAKTAASLHHTNIVPVFGVGEDQGFHYYVMQCIDGHGLDRVMTAGDYKGLSATQVAHLGRQAAEGLDHAHSQKVLHRDIKPANLIVNRDLDLWVTDFGVAKAIESEAVTRTGDVVGTLRYMAPEQIVGTSDFRSDIYSLGVTLYEILAGRPAMDDASIRSAIVSRRPVSSPTPLRQLNPDVPKDLETILNTAMAIDPKERYHSAAQMADDLERFINGETISVRPLSWAESSWRWARRNPAVAALSSLSFLLLVGVAASSLFGYLRTQELLHSEQVARRNAEQTAEMAAGALDQVFERFAVGSPGQRSSASQFASSPALSNETAHLLEDLVHYFDSFAARTQANPELQQSSLNARISIGDIHLQLGQYDEATGSFRSSLANLDMAAANAKVDAASLHNRIGFAHRMLGKTQLAEESFHRAVLLLEEHLAEESPLPDPARGRFELARSFYLLGMQLGPGMRPDSMPPPMALWGDAPGPGLGPGRRFDRSPPHLRAFGHEQRSLRPTAKRREYLLRSMEILRQLISADEPNLGYQISLAACLKQLAGDSLTKRSDQEDGFEKEAIEILRALSRSHPEDEEVLLELARVLSGFTVYEPMNHDDHLIAVERFREAVKYCDLLATSHPNVPRYNNALTHSLFRLGVLLERMSRHGPPRRPVGPSQKDWEAEASDAYQQAAMRHAVLLRQHPEAEGYLAWDAVFLLRHGELLSKLGSHEQAEVAVTKSAETFKSLCNSDPKESIVWEGVPRAYQTLSLIQNRMGHHGDAQESEVEAQLGELLLETKRNQSR